jgi:hypothetical protein
MAKHYVTTSEPKTKNQLKVGPFDSKKSMERKNYNWIEGQVGLSLMDEILLLLTILAKISLPFQFNFSKGCTTVKDDLLRSIGVRKICDVYM